MCTVSKLARSEGHRAAMFVLRPLFEIFSLGPITCLLFAMMLTDVRAESLEPLVRGDQPQRPWLNLGFGGPKVRFESLLGLSVVSSSDYLGAETRSTSIRPLGAIRVGRLRLSTSGSSALLDFGGVTDEAGASLDLVRSTGLKIRTGLRLTSGRKSSDADELIGIPDVRRTAIGRLAVSYELSPRWRAVSALNVDVLGRGNGLFWTSGVDYRQRLGAATELRLGAGISLGNATHLRSFYGVPQSAVTPSRPYYEPGAGAKDVALSLNLTHALTPSWITFAGLTYARLIGPAADSPLAHRRDNIAFITGIGWRFRRQPDGE